MKGWAENSSALQRIKVAFGIYSLAVTFFCGTVHGAESTSESVRCLSRLQGSSAVSASGAIRFSIRDPYIKYSITRPEVVLEVPPKALASAGVACGQLRSPTGALLVKSLSVRTATKFNDENPEPKILAFSDMAEKGLEVAAQDYIERIHSWVPQGQRFGLTLYQEIARIRNGAEPPKVMILGARFVGRSKSGRYSEIMCVDFDYTKDVQCRFREQLQDNIMLSAQLSTRSLQEWERVSEIGEELFRQFKRK